MQLYIASYRLFYVALKNTRGPTCGKAEPSVAVIVCYTWSGGTSMATKLAVDGLGDHLRYDRSISHKCVKIYNITVSSYGVTRCQILKGQIKF